MTATQSKSAKPVAQPEPFEWVDDPETLAEIVARIQRIGFKNTRMELRGTAGRGRRIRLVDKRTSLVAKNENGTDCEDLNNVHRCPVECPDDPPGGG